MPATSLNQLIKPSFHTVAFYKFNAVLSESIQIPFSYAAAVLFFTDTHFDKKKLPFK